MAPNSCPLSGGRNNGIRDWDGGANIADHNRCSPASAGPAHQSLLHQVEITVATGSVHYLPVHFRQGIAALALGDDAHVGGEGGDVRAAEGFASYELAVARHCLSQVETAASA